jgi:hypothetical protein
MLKVSRVMVVCTVFGLCAVSPAWSDDEKLARILPQFFVEGITLDTADGHDAHFVNQGQALEAMEQVNATLSSQFSTYPLPSSSGAFTTQFDPETGAPVATSASFGPIFAERPETLGKNKINIGFSAIFSDYESIDGFGLDNGDIVFNLVHSDTNSDGSNLTDPFEGDLISTQLFMSLSLSTEVVFATWGATDRFDLGIAVPWVAVDLAAMTRNSILPLTGTNVHAFDCTVTNCLSGNPFVADVSKSGKASGVGDVTLRSKYNFRKGFAGALDLRLPTGDEKDFLGSGATQARLMLIARGAKYDVLYGGLYPHLNLGLTISDGGYSIPFPTSGTTTTLLVVEPSDEINYAVGFDAALGRRVTFAVDAIGRILIDARTLEMEQADFFYTTLAGSVARETRTETVTEKTDLNLLLGTVGLKVNLGGALLLTGGVLFPIIDDRGLEDQISINFGLDYTF